jgi:hypothetical protein
MIPTKNDTELWVQVGDNNKVWLGTSTQTAQNTKMTVSEFAEQPWIKGSKVIRILGDWENAELIVKLWRSPADQEPAPKIFLAKQSYRTLRQLGADWPSRSISGMRHISDPPSVGGWHRMTHKEVPVYSLIARQSLLRRRLDATTDAIFRNHPAFPAFDFLHSGDKFWAVQLFNMLIDPRWHVSSSQTDSRYHLLKFMQLHALNNDKEVFTRVFDYADIQDTDDPNLRLAMLATRPWLKKSHLSGGASDRFNKPRYFLQRIVQRYDDKNRGVFEAARVFLCFVADVWLDNLFPHRSYKMVKKTSRLQPCTKYSPQLFVAKHFFTEPATARSWERYVRRRLT